MLTLPPVPSEDLSHILEYAESDFHVLAGARLFLTGCTGFFGVWILEALAEANKKLGLKIHVNILSRNPEVFAGKHPHLANNECFSWTRGDIRSFSVPSGVFDFIFHGATSANAALNSQSPREMFETIVHGTERVLNAAIQMKAQSLLLMSSGAVYGVQPPDLLKMPENYAGGPNPCSKLSAYAEGKRSAELLCAMTPEIETKIARCFAFIGPHLPLNAHFAAGNFLRDAMAGRAIMIQGDGRPLRSYLYAADLVIWLLAVLVRGKGNIPYNVGSDEAVSIEELANLVAKKAEKPVKIEIMKSTGAGLPPRYIPDITRAKCDLGLDIKIPLQKSIQSTFQWLIV